VYIYIYISRDVDFDECICPFASLRPNVGAHLRAKLTLLPDILINPPNFGDASLHDKHLFSPISTDVVHSSCEAGVSTGENPASAAENPEQNSAKSAYTAPYFMCLPRGGSVRSQVDTPDGTGESSSESMMGSMRQLLASSSDAQEISGGGSSMPE
jgi:hypothetical protein